MAARIIKTPFLDFLFYYSFVLGMIAYPKPNKSLRNFNAKNAKAHPNSDRTVFPNFFKVKGRMTQICFEELRFLSAKSWTGLGRA